MSRVRNVDTEKYPEYEWLAMNVELARHAHGWTQVELARRVGTTQEYISGVERARVNATLEMLSALARELGTSVSALFARPEGP